MGKTLPRARVHDGDTKTRLFVRPASVHDGDNGVGSGARWCVCDRWVCATTRARARRGRVFFRGGALLITHPAAAIPERLEAVGIAAGGTVGGVDGVGELHV